MAKTSRPKADRRKSTLTTLAPATADEHNGVTAAAIAKRAFEFYCERGFEHGKDVADWLEAERELSYAGR